MKFTVPLDEDRYQDNDYNDYEMREEWSEGSESEVSQNEEQNIHENAKQK